MSLTTDFVHPDEPCYGLYEGPLIHNLEWRWCQVVRVIRDDKKAEYLKDFGPSDLYSYITPIMMPSFGENTVAQLQDHADKNREDTYWQRRAIEQQEASTLIEDHIRQYAQIQEIRANRSSFGPAVRVQRNGFSGGRN